jgi:SAM-dependent methyltransferase
MNQPADETPEFWRSHSHDDLVRRVAELHRQRRENSAASGEKEVTAARRAVADLFIKGEGIEVGAGARRFPIPSHAQCYYGDIRDQEQLASYFKSKDVVFTGFIDAETFGPIAEGSLDFIISAHVIEHLENPICSILGGLQKLKAAGIYLLVVPDARHTFDRQRPLTSEKHLFADFEDGGAGTRLEAYRDFVRYTAVAEWGEIIAPEKIDSEAARLSTAGMDIHFHTWTGDTFLHLLRSLFSRAPFDIIGSTFVINENIFVLRKL